MKAKNSLLALAVVLSVTFTTGACASKTNKAKPRKNGIVVAIKDNRGLCCRVGVAKVRHIRKTNNMRYAMAGVNGGNDIQGVKVVLWHGTRAWSVVDYGTQGCEGYGYLPKNALRELYGGRIRASCFREIQNNPRKAIEGALEGDPFVVDLYANEKISGMRVVSSRAVEERYAVTRIELREPNGSKRTRYVLVRKGTELWAAVDVRKRPQKLGCELITQSQRLRLRLPNDC